MITQVLIVQGYTSVTADLISIKSEAVVKIYDNPSYPVHAISAIKNGNSVRTKISMEKTNANYRALVLPLGTAAVTGYAEYTASWAVS